MEYTDYPAMIAAQYCGNVLEVTLNRLQAFNPLNTRMDGTGCSLLSRPKLARCAAARALQGRDPRAAGHGGWRDRHRDILAR